MEFIETLNHKYHLQGITSDGEYMYWSCTDTILKTTLGGSPRVQTEIAGGHLGDCDYYDGRIYVSYLGNALPGHPWGDWTAFFIYVLDPKDLRVIDRIKLDICYKYWEEKDLPGDTRGFRGIDGITVAPDRESGEPKIFTACGLTPDAKYTEQLILRFDLRGNYETEYRIPIGNCDLGIQNLDYDASRDEFWMTGYGKRFDFQSENTLYCVSGDLGRVISQYKFPTGVGFHCLGDGEFWATAQWGVKWKKGAIAYRCREEFFKNDLTEPEVIRLVSGREV